MSTLDPAGSHAADVARLWWVMLAGAGVLAALVWAILWRAMRRGGGEQASERLWVGGLGLAMPVAVLLALLVYAILLGNRHAPRPDGAVQVSAVASRYDWRFGYPGGRASARVLHIPAGRPVDVSLTATDVIHAFWVPRLGGKLDAIPGQTNVLRIVADRPGRYYGLCAEYCGPGHAGHGFSVVAHDPERWATLTGAAR